MSDFGAQKRQLKHDLGRALDELEKTHNEEIEELKEELKEAEDTVKAYEEEEETNLRDTGLALDTLFRTPDGRRLIERAFRTDPKRTSMELSYLGADDIRGELEVATELGRVA